MSTYDNEPKQSIWQIWFVSSIIILLSFLFIGTVIEELCDNQIYIILLIISFINAICAIIVGLKTND